MPSLRGTYSLKRNIRQQIQAHRKAWGQRRVRLTIQRLGDDDVFLPSPYQRHAPMTYGTGKALTRIVAATNIGEEVVG